MEISDPDEVILQVDALLARHRTGLARSMLEPALKAHPGHPGLLLKSAWIDYLDDQTVAAHEKVSQVVQVEPENPSARLLLFEILRERGKAPEAEAAILDLIREWPEHAYYYGRYGQLMLTALQVDKASRLAAEGLKYDPDELECLAVLTVCDFIDQRSGAGSQGLQQMLIRHPASIHTLRLVIASLQQRGDLKGARRLSQELVQVQPDSRSGVELASELRYLSHWSMWPLWPLQRYGWGASFAIWIGVVVLLQVMRRTSPELVPYLVAVFLLYVVYSWVWPSILKRLLR